MHIVFSVTTGKVTIKREPGVLDMTGSRHTGRGKVRETPVSTRSSTSKMITPNIDLDLANIFFQLRASVDDTSRSIAMLKPQAMIVFNYLPHRSVLIQR